MQYRLKDLAIAVTLLAMWCALVRVSNDLGVVLILSLLGAVIARVTSRGQIEWLGCIAVSSVFGFFGWVVVVIPSVGFSFTTGRVAIPVVISMIGSFYVAAIERDLSGG